MADDAVIVTPAEGRALVPICPWCSATLPVADAAACPSCEARLVDTSDVDIPGLTTVDPAMLAAAAAPRKIRRTFGSLLVRNDDEIPPPSEAEMPALARPDADVRREILRLEMEARLASLTAEVASRDAERSAVTANSVPPHPAPPQTGPETGQPPETGGPAETGKLPETGGPAGPD
ncbi:MAG: hypothetical protein V2B17_05640 [Chloroflexota bacterium]